MAKFTLFFWLIIYGFRSVHQRLFVCFISEILLRARLIVRHAKKSSRTCGLCKNVFTESAPSAASEVNSSSEARTTVVTGGAADAAWAQLHYRGCGEYPRWSQLVVWLCKPNARPLRILQIKTPNCHLLSKSRGANRFFTTWIRLVFFSCWFLLSTNMHVDSDSNETALIDGPQNLAF